MSLDPHKAVLIAYSEMDFCNPLSPALLDRVLSVAALKPGCATLDLGCGNAAMAIHLAETYGCHVEAIERSPAVAAIAAERIKGRGASGRVTLHNVTSRDFLTGERPYDLLVAVGPS